MAKIAEDASELFGLEGPARNPVRGLSDLWSSETTFRVCYGSYPVHRDIQRFSCPNCLLC